MNKLTKRQIEIFTFIKKEIAETGLPPTRAEIAKKMGFSSPNAAEDHLKAIAKKGVIELLHGTSRGIKILNTTLPVIIFDQSQVSNFKLDDNSFNTKIDYFFKLTTATPELNLQSGDLVAIQNQNMAQINQIVITKKNNNLILCRYTENLEITGIAIGMIRTFNNDI